MSNIPYNITGSAITLLIDARTHTVNRGDDRYDAVKDAIRSGDFDSIPALLDLKGRLISESNGGLYLLNGRLRCSDYDVPSLLSNRIIAMVKERMDVTPLALFLENLMQNPNESGTVINELYGFIEACNLPITADGHFLAYKMVGNNFKDLYSGRMDNSVGQTVTIDRSVCDFNRGNTCSVGLHFCSQGYLGHYGTRSSSQVVVVKVNPRDVTSIPTDYNNAKGRACRYEIVDAIEWDELITPLYTDEYSDVEDDLFDGVDQPVPTPVSSDDNRWEVRGSNTGRFIDSFAARQDARDFRNDIAATDDTFIWDSYNNIVVAGTVSDSVDLDSLPDEVAGVSPNASAKLNDAVVRAIKTRLRHDDYDTLTGLADEYGVSDRTIRRIRDGESWTHVRV